MAEAAPAARSETPLEALVAAVRAHSDMSPLSLRTLGEEFLAAHSAAQGGLSIEVGTRGAGSALLCLNLLAMVYERPPCLFTVDPYGDKPYESGIAGVCKGVFGDDMYTAAKLLLAVFPNHAHFLLEDGQFWARCRGLPYWRGGRRHTVNDLAFVLLDGDHDSQSIWRGVRSALPMLRAGGRIVIDNVDADPMTIEVVGRLLADQRGRARYRPLTPAGAAKKGEAQGVVIVDEAL